MRRCQQVLRWTGIGAAIAVTVAGLALAGAYAFVQSDWGRAQMVEFLNRQLSTPGASSVRIGRLEGDLPARIEIHDVEVADSAGTWLRLEHAGVSWSPMALLSGTLRVSNLKADGLQVLRRPRDAESSGEFRWPQPPLGIAVEHFSLADAVLETPVLGERVQFRASGDTAIEGADRVQTTIDLRRTDGVSGRARLEAVFQPRSEQVHFELAVNEGDGGVIARAMDLEGLPSLSIQAEGEGPLDNVRGGARMRAGDLASLDTSFALDVRDPFGFAFDGKARIARLAQPPWRDLLEGDVAFEMKGTLSGDRLEMQRASAANQFARVELAGGLEGTTANVDVSIAAHDLAQFSHVAGFPVRGQADIRATIRSKDLGEGATVSAEAVVTEPLPETSPVRKLLGPRVTVAGVVELDARQSWRLRDVRAEGASVSMQANASLGVDSLEGDYELRLPKLSALSGLAGTPLAGELTATGSIGGSLTHATLTADVTTANLSVDAALVGAVHARMNATGSADGLGGDVDLSVDNDPVGRVTLVSRFAAGADVIRFDGLSVASREAELGGAVTIDLSNATATGKLAGSALPLATWSDLAGRALSGSADVAIEMAPGREGQGLDLSVAAGAVSVAQPGQDAIAVDAIDASARIDDLFGAPRGKMHVVATNAAIADARLAAVALDVQMKDLRHASAQLKAEGEAHGRFALDASADYRGGEGTHVLTVSALDGSFEGQPFALSQPARLEHDGETTLLSNSTLAIAGGHVTAHGRVGVEEIGARVDIDRLSLADLHTLVPMTDVTGTLSGHAQIAGTRMQPTGEIDLRASDVRAVDSAITAAKPLSASLRGDWSDGLAHLKAVLDEIAETRVDARVDVPLRLDPDSLAFTVPAAEALDGELRWSGGLEPVWDLLSPYEDRLSGSGKLALDLGGSVGHPQVSGTFQVSGGRYENVLSGTSLEDVELRLVGAGDRLVVETLTATDGGRGSLSGGGTIDFDPARSYPTNLRLEFSDMLLVARDDLTLVAGGNLALEGTLVDALLSGEIVTGTSELSLAGTLPPEVVELEVEEVDSSLGMKAVDTGSVHEKKPSRIRLALNLSVPGRAFVRGLGLESEWKGDVKISGDARTPNVAGVLHPVRGRFAFMGKHFTLEQGAIRFTGSDNVDPLLDLKAEHEASRLTAFLNVTGTASKPKISLTSRPPMPESEIASQVLFGTDSSNLSPAQSLQLASTLAAISGAGGAGGILDATRRTLGVDVIDFAESEEDPEKTRVSVGKYVTDGVYIELDRGTEEDSITATTVEVEVAPDVKIEGGTTEQGGNKVGVKWKWDY